MLALDLDVDMRPGAELDTWMRELCRDSIMIMLKSEAGPSGHPLVTVYAESRRDLDNWLRNYYVLDSAGPMVYEDVAALMAMTYRPETTWERVKDALMWMFAGALFTFAMWMLVNVLISGHPW